MIKISGIQPIYNGVSSGYPFIEAILSVLPIVDEFLINDGGSSDSTLLYLQKLEKTFPSKIKLFQRPFFSSDYFETIDECLEFLIGQATGDWLFEVQGDEVWHENNLLTIKTVIEMASRESYNSIRTACSFGSSFYDLFTAYRYKNVRILRKLKDLKSGLGGDHWYLGNNNQPAQGFTTSNVPPEFILNIVTYFNVGYLSFLGNALKRTETTFKFFARQAQERKVIWESLKNYLPPEQKLNSNVVVKLPALIQGLVGLQEYKVREELFDKSFLKELTGLNYE